MATSADVHDKLRQAWGLLVECPVSCPCKSEELCGQPGAQRIRDLVLLIQEGLAHDTYSEDLDSLIDLANTNFKKFPHRLVPICWRSVHTDASILRCICDMLRPDADSLGQAFWAAAIERLDLALIVSGAPGEGRLDIIYDLIELIQSLRLPLLRDPFASDDTPELDTAARAEPDLPPHAQVIVRLPAPPSLAAFTKTLHTTPFILPGFLSDWPALNEHPWRSRSYLLRAAGRGRVVPVELGADYTRDDWGQTFMPWESFLLSLSESADVKYLAQHDLLTQFPALRSDVIVPDYVYADIPGARDTLALNAWVGCRGAGSPAHTDAFANCYCLVTGRKSVWLAPPAAEVSAALDPDGNTARVDVFAAEQHQRDPTADKFMRDAVPYAMAAVLQPGDMLYLPRGWWHAFRNEDTSFAVSMWF
ncbi:Clavaminate synthase-like protein [Auricularia subglabra TFB-10046 SS5]|nr:Clavaminate synthase-like protein [Auricularia subglabra TFB-10046 SS5]